jgi:hypothetical protein
MQYLEINWHRKKNLIFITYSTYSVGLQNIIAIQGGRVNCCVDFTWSDPHSALRSTASDEYSNNFSKCIAWEEVIIKLYPLLTEKTAGEKTILVS